MKQQLFNSFWIAAASVLISSPAFSQVVQVTNVQLNPTENGQGHSPYSSICSRAGNPLLISPELLVADGLLNDEALESYFEAQENLYQSGRVAI